MFVYDSEQLDILGYEVSLYHNKYLSDNCSMRQVAQCMNLNAGQQLLHYDDPEKFVSRASYPMTVQVLSSSLYDGGCFTSLFVDEHCVFDVSNPHLIVHMNIEAHKYESIMCRMYENGGASHFVLTQGQNCSNEKKSDRSDDSLHHLLVQTIYSLVVEELTAQSLHCSLTGNTPRVQYSLVVEAVLTAADIMVCNTIMKFYLSCKCIT